MPVLVTREKWGARQPAGRPTHVAISARTATCIHYDGAVPIVVRTLADAYALMRRDQNQHMDVNGWDDIGYNFLVISAPGFPVDGLVMTGRGRDIVGAHCLNHNTEWIGVQISIGGNQKPSPSALLSTRQLHASFVIAAGHNLAMKGHRDGFPTKCPGEILYAWVKAGMPVPAAAAPPATTSKSASVKPTTPPEDTMPWFMRSKAGAIVIVGPTGVRLLTPAQWSTWRNLGAVLAPGMGALDPGPFQAVVASLGGIVK